MAQMTLEDKLLVFGLIGFEPSPEMQHIQQLVREAAIAEQLEEERADSPRRRKWLCIAPLKTQKHQQQQ